ncbi:glycogen debranching protein [Paludisphaera mucosa]|uniref:Isoamylase n=1 Tax=Paludisphaera mucosa TaxID=3030827 RepID=A0ABT6FEJ5_9BACT|nr:isoamylase [Paludisphaera mucosa]
MLPPGAAWIEQQRAHNFMLYSRRSERVTLLLFGEADPARPLLALDLDPRVHKTWDIWHCRVEEERARGARYYAYSVDGPRAGGSDRHPGFDPDKVLLDPYARDVFFPPSFDREAARRPGPNAGMAPLGVLPRREAPFDWEDDRPPRHDSEAVIYEMHVRGFTNAPASGVAAGRRGTFAGVVDKIPHLRDLGVTIVELLPVQQFDPQEGNYWGYMTLNFFAPHHSFAADVRDARREFKEMVKALHRAGIEVVLDVVYNHTAEGDQAGPTYSFKGIDSATYYLASDDPARPYLDYSGCGNTLACHTGAVRTLILESLRYWVTEMHVDGFRFDLASVLARNADGSFAGPDVPLLTAIRTDPVLRDVRLIAEPWDAAGAYQLGVRFPGALWHQWNGRFRDDVRRFVRGDRGTVPALMMRLYGSDDLFPDTPRDARRPSQSINYVTCHDGFTLYDLVSYDRRHNEANGHDNIDGAADNLSWNCGWEGDDGLPAEVAALRRRQAKNLCCLLLLANGVPMISAGDELLQTQRGNNNPYNQDNGTTWLDWGRLTTHADHFRFVRLMIAFRKAHPTLGRSRFWRDDVRWYGVGPSADTGDDSHSLAYALRGASQGDGDLYVMINAYHEPLTFTVQEGSPGCWGRVIDTALPSPDDIVDTMPGPPVPSMEYRVQARSVVVLLRRAADA